MSQSDTRKEAEYRLSVSSKDASTMEQAAKVSDGRRGVSKDPDSLRIPSVSEEDRMTKAAKASRDKRQENKSKGESTSGQSSSGK
ncbi:hypothetical protein IWZ01DRAFT_247835 [Phyllosticta capitalensis]